MIRIDKELNDALDKDAKDHGVSENALISSILVRYVDWDRYSEKFGRVSMSNETQIIMQTIHCDKLKKAAQEFAESVPSPEDIFLLQ